MSIPLLSGVGDALDFYQRNVTDPWSGSILKALNKAKMGLGLGDQGSDTIDQLDPHQVDNFAYQDNPLGRFAFETVTDPLNLVGLGLPGKLAETGAAHAIPGAVSLLDKAQWADQLPHALVGGGMDKIGGFLQGPIMDAAAKAEPYVSKFASDNPGLANAWQKTNLLWKELAHDIPGYSMRNVADDAIRSAAYGDGQSAGDIITGFPGAVGDTLAGRTSDAGAASDWTDTFGRALGNDDFHPGDLSKAVTDTGVSTVGPESQFRSLQSKVQQHQSQTQRTLSSGAPVFDANGNPVMGPTINGPKDWLLDKGAGLLDKISALGEWNKRLEQNQELRTRGPVWGNKAQELIGQSADPMSQALLKANPAYADLASELMDRSGMISPSEMRERLLDLGAPQSYADPASEKWMNAQALAERGADQWTNKTQFQYSNHPYQDRIQELNDSYPGQFTGLPTSSADLHALDYSDPQLMASFAGGRADAGKLLSKTLRDAHAEQVLRGIAQNTFGGYKFAAQNVPAMIRLAGEHPSIANIPAEYYRDSDIYNYSHGNYGSGFHGMMPLGTNPLNGDQIEFNPGNLSSIAELVGSATDKSSDSSSGLGGAADTLGDLSLGLNPLLKLGLQLSGQAGDHQMSDIIRPLTLASGAASIASGQPIDLEQPLKDLVGAGEQSLTGKETFPYQDYLLRQRQAELTGTGNKWDATQTSGPIHDAATLDTAHRVGAEDLLRTLTPLDLKMVTPEASQISHNSAISNYLGSRGLTRQAGANPTAQTYALADPLAERVARFETLSPDERMALLRDPRALEMLQKQRMLQLHNPQALAAG